MWTIYKLWKTNEHTILKLWTLIKNIIECTHKFPYNILFTFLMDRGRAPNGIGHLMILWYDDMIYDMKSYHTMPYHIISCHVMSCHVTSCHVISYHIIYHIISHIISYHNIPYIISYTTYPAVAHTVWISNGSDIYIYTRMHFHTFMIQILKHRNIFNQFGLMSCI